MASDNNSQQLLDVLGEDRARLRKRVGMPAWLAPTIAVFFAAWVASPAIGEQTSSDVYLISVIGTLLAIYFATRAAGVRHGGLRGRGVGVVAVTTLIGLALYSTSLGLVSFDLRWWVVLPALAAAGLGHAATLVLERLTLARVTRVR